MTAMPRDSGRYTHLSVKRTELLANRIVFVLALVGAGIALYLTLAHWNYLELQCGEIAGCEEVAAHPSARGFGIRGLEYVPTAFFGLLMFLTVAMLSFVRAAYPVGRIAELARRAQLALVLISIGVFAYLTYLEAFVIRAWCQWCVASSVVTLLMAPFLFVRASHRSESHAP